MELDIVFRDDEQRRETMLPIDLNGPTVGIVLKELVRRAIITIRNERFVFDANEKRGYSGEMDDVLTTADIAAQEVYLRTLTECFPGAGLIGEEDNLSISCRIPGIDVYFTIDPLDGTKAFVREQSHGTGTMLAMVVDGQVVSAWIGDINTQELYGYRPGSDKVHRISGFESSKYLHELPRVVDLRESYILLRESRTRSPNCIHGLAKKFKSEVVDGGSIGIWMARLWKGEVPCAVMDPGFDTPWDSTPLIGICKKLGFVFLRSIGNTWSLYEPKLVREPQKQDYWIAVVHESNLEQLKNLM